MRSILNKRNLRRIDFIRRFTLPRKCVTVMRKEDNMRNKPVALVTGANKGIGLQIAKDLVAHGFTVLVGSRKLESGETAAKRVGADARALQLDVH
jgi:short chain dehydrogenase